MRIACVCHAFFAQSLQSLNLPALHDIQKRIQSFFNVTDFERWFYNHIRVCNWDGSQFKQTPEIRTSEHLSSFATITRAPLATFGHDFGHWITDVLFTYVPPPVSYSCPFPFDSSLHGDKNTRSVADSVQSPFSSCTDSAGVSMNRKCGYCFTRAMLPHI